MTLFQQKFKAAELLNVFLKTAWQLASNVILYNYITYITLMYYIMSHYGSVGNQSVN